MAPATVPTVSLRPMRLADYSFALSLYLATNAPLLAKLGHTDTSAIIDRFKHGHRHSRSRIILHDARSIGWIEVSETSVGLHLHQLFLIGVMRNRGIGTSLISGLQQRAQHLARPLSLNVVRGNPALSLYRRLGFSVVGERDGRLQMRWSALPPQAR